MQEEHPCVFEYLLEGHLSRAWQSWTLVNLDPASSRQARSIERLVSILLPLRSARPSPLRLWQVLYPLHLPADLSLLTSAAA